MNWGKVAKNGLRTALVFAAIGAVLAFAAPVIGALVGMEVTAGMGVANIGFQAAFFGMFGGMSAAINTLLGERAEAKNKEVTVNFVIKRHGPEQGAGLTVNHHHTVNNDIGMVAVDASQHNVNLDASEKLKIVDKSENNLLVDVDADARRTKNVGVDNSEHIKVVDKSTNIADVDIREKTKLVDKSDNVTLVDVDAQEKTKFVNKGAFAVNTLPATTVTDAEARAMLLGPAASAAIN